jgi:hypothetical protein
VNQLIQTRGGQSLAAGSTEFDVAFFPLTAGHHADAATEIALKLQQATADGDWSIAWMITTTEAIVMVLQRPTPVTPPPKGSIGGYGGARG